MIFIINKYILFIKIIILKNKSNSEIYFLKEKMCKRVNMLFFTNNIVLRNKNKSKVYFLINKSNSKIYFSKKTNL